MFDSGLNYSTLNTARSALSNVISFSDNASVYFGKHPLVIRFMRGVFTLRPKLPKLADVWNSADVLNYINGMGKNCDMTLMNLSLKLSMLLALVYVERVQCLQLLDLNFMHKNSKVRNEIETKRNETKRNQQKRNETKRNQRNENEIK